MVPHYWREKYAKVGSEFEKRPSLRPPLDLPYAMCDSGAETDFDKGMEDHAMMRILFPIALLTMLFGSGCGEELADRSDNGGNAMRAPSAPAEDIGEEENADSITLQFGTGSPQVPPIGLKAIVAGFHHTCVLLQDGTARCWGANECGHLGDGTTDDRLTPVPVVGLTDAVALTAASTHTCALISDGTAQCWGDNGAGQLGDGTSMNSRLTPVAVVGLHEAVALTAGAWHTCALLKDGTALCWGLNDAGQVGDGTQDNWRLTPFAVVDLWGIVAVTAGGTHTCALLEDGTAQCWGCGAWGQLGDGTTDCRPTPAPVLELEGAVALTAANDHTCAVLKDGTVRCWGRNSLGQLADGTTNDLLMPAPVLGLQGAVALTGWGFHTCVLLKDETAKCWGTNWYGELGDGTTDDRLMPVPVAGLIEATALAAGAWHTCARFKNGSAKCWGSNLSGQLGNGTFANASTPTLVKF